MKLSQMVLQLLDVVPFEKMGGLCIKNASQRQRISLPRKLIACERINCFIHLLDWLVLHTLIGKKAAEDIG